MSSIRFAHSGFTFRLLYDAEKDRVLRAFSIAGQSARAFFIEQGGGWLFKINGAWTDADGVLGPTMVAIAEELMATAPLRYEDAPCL
ncbi:MAG TPA: hypothetical protein VGD81_15480 [Opitutaceae bacterium]